MLETALMLKPAPFLFLTAARRTGRASASCLFQLMRSSMFHFKVK